MTDQPEPRPDLLNQRCQNPNCDLNAPPEPLPTDTMYSSRPAFLPAPELCSRCLQTLHPTDDVVRWFTPAPGWQYRYHRKCLYPSTPSSPESSPPPQSTDPTSSTVTP